jgi:hypothetical protein
MDQNSIQQSQLSPAPQQPVSQPHSSSKLYIILGVFVLLVSIGVGAYVLGTKHSQPPTQIFPAPVTPIPTTQTDSTAGWKMYTNQTYGFSFTYPTEWVLVDNISGAASGIPSVYQINIDNPKKEKNALPGIILEISKSKDDIPQYSSPNITQETIDGIAAVRQSIPSGMQSALEAVFFKKGVNYYRITLAYEDKKTPQRGEYNATSVDIFNKILSTFKFTNSPEGGDQAQAIDTSAWKTYSNSSIKLSFMYPSTWTVKETKDNGNNSGFEATGPEGTITAAWGSGFGGGCEPENHIQMTILGKIQDMCHFINKDGTESWNQIYQEIDPNTTYSMSATANAPHEKNSETIKKMFTTFTLGK